MRIFTEVIDSLVEAALDRIRRRRRDVGEATLSVASERRSTQPTKTITIHEAVNGQLIEFVRHKFNPNGPDEYLREVYIVRENETLVDAISTVLVLTDK